MSRELILSMTVSLDGFVSGPNGEVDWMFPGMSDEGREWVSEQFWKAGLMAMGHNSYKAWTDFWPMADNILARPMNEIPKAVFSRSGVIQIPEMEKARAALAEGRIQQSALETWQKPTVSGKDLVADIQGLKAEDGKPILVLGGISFAKSLIAASLIDVYRLSVHPVVLGRGNALFGGLEAPLRFKLEDVQQFQTGAMVKTYRPV